MACSWSHLLEQKPQLALRLAHPLAEAVGSLPHEERHLPVAVAALVGQRSGDERLPRPRRTVKQTTSETDGRRCSVKVPETNYVLFVLSQKRCTKFYEVSDQH